MKKPFKQTFGMDEKEYDKKFGKKVHPATSPKSNRKLTLLGKAFIVFLVVCGVSILGLSLYANALYNNVKVSPQPTTKNEAKVADPVSNTDEPPASKSSTNQPANSSNPSVPNDQLPAYTPKPVKQCTFANIPYNTYFTAGTGPSIEGYTGYSDTCYPDGNTPVTTVRRAPRDKIIYINVSSADYTTAYNICKSYTGFVDSCMQVVWHP